MGAWGHQNFENDSAMDFVGEFIESPNLDVINEALSVVIEAGAEEEYIEVDEASAALAAAEIVAAALGQAATDVPEELPASIQKIGLTVDDKMLKKARKAVKQVLRESELQELWQEGGEPNEWQQVQEGLLKRLGQV
ncbi:DUF4259 domain-containing protein [Hymenobacter siberiensis]|jgi:hypothetical protein|uniref:DUF4259 domain-containing protein n=1 Tax=Hymenobacter siberiensis TaxID=2848396 RepID=UPI001C1E7EFC|nr:DUF4259 domain-containing protein [Hymenobacter siberiensis]MBU6121846.1 DUF4259 domain-containing protein [Hymenobacter siberiensis]